MVPVYSDHDVAHLRRMPLSTRANDPILGEIALAIWTLFPECLICGGRIARFEDADIRIHSHRAVHLASCPPKRPPDQTGDAASIL